ncbi:uncharacterized protein N7482_000916 [Penicillium canariense]|uniref:Uncharacterized protein n=1 Tax=Penicillium canariense TaxID=189055 RepID=A0A9W9LTE1_9EURO|nr:uncharacterized protein N7482_000916 [Penicillium canariense]KAJ5175039.1 hypothetical protein N7482_000916 [Penicillium canariense]
MAPATNSDVIDASSSGPFKQVRSSKSAIPSVQEFEYSTATVNDIVNALKITGGVIVRNFLGREEIDRIMEDVNPYLDADKPWADGKATQRLARFICVFDALFSGDFFPQETRRAYGMMGKSPTFATSIVGNPLWLSVSDALLTSHIKYNWVGDKVEESTSLPQLHNTIVFRIGPGARAQPLHRDDAPHHPDHRAVAEHTLGRDCGIGLFVAGTRTTKANGATRFIPGSHLWDYREGPPNEAQTVQAELNTGDAFMMLSGCFHGGSANTTEDEYRVLLSTFNCRGWLRQEENQYLANSIDSVRGLPPALQERMGYGLSKPFMGWVDLKSPMLMLHPDEPKYKMGLL